MSEVTVADVTAWLDELGDDEFARREEIGIYPEWNYLDEAFGSGIQNLVLQAERSGRFVPHGTSLFLVADTEGTIEGGIVTVDVPIDDDHTIRIASFFEEWKHLTNNREAMGDAAAAAVLESIAQTAEATITRLRAVLP